MLEPNSKSDLINVCYDDKISLENNGKRIKISIENEQAAEYLKQFLNGARFGERLDGKRKEEDDYKIELVKNSDHTSVIISGDLVNALHDLNGLDYISDEKEKQLLGVLENIEYASRKGAAAKMLFHRKPYHALSSNEAHVNGKTQTAHRPSTTVGNGLSKKP